MPNENSARTIMVVEDYDDTRMLLKKGLEGLGYSVLEASNGQEAVGIRQERQCPQDRLALPSIALSIHGNDRGLKPRRIEHLASPDQEGSARHIVERPPSERPPHAEAAQGVGFFSGQRERRASGTTGRIREGDAERSDITSRASAGLQPGDTVTSTPRHDVLHDGQQERAGESHHAGW